ncbi:cytochrome P450 protein [Rutstroemia sp. NJR-2017a BBW]|nr:cytochrome P450 protein [Rutstroemia sp. NJR-2017a BBW]
MAFSSSSGLLFALCPFGLYVLYVLWSSARYRYAMHKAGCSTPVQYHHRDPVFGLDLFMKRIQAMKDGTWLDIDDYLFSNYGKTVQTNYFGKKQYATMDSQNIQTVLATQVDKFGSAPMNYEPTKLFLGEGIINTDGARWKRSRQLINPIFTRAQVSELSSFEVHVRKFLDKIPRNGSTVDFQPLCKMLYLDSTTEFLFGKSANSLSPETSSLFARRLPEVFDDALRGMLTRFLLGKFKFLAPGGKEWREKCAEVHAIIDHYIEEDIEAQKNESTNPSDTPYSYVLLRELAKTTDDRLAIRNELMNIFFPARDSAAVLTSNAIFLLARHPDVWRRGREEVLAIGSEKLTFEKLKSLKYLHCIINEILSFGVGKPVFLHAFYHMEEDHSVRILYF